MNAQNPQKLKRPPVVVVMGHVDHGKTTLLDFIRKANVAAKEAGGITQAVGAYEIKVPPKAELKSRASEAKRGILRDAQDDFAIRKITFIDTPGHEAFTKMRSRGAKIADIAILVVAADDGVQPQTEEAIKIIQAEEIPFVVAINKIDKQNADIERTKSQLAQKNILLEGFGGSVSFQSISAKTGQGVEELLDLILLATDVEGLTYNPTAPASGFILEAHRNSRIGNTVTAIVKDGTLKTGELIYAGSAGGKIKGLKNFLGKPAKELAPSSPAIILGFDSLPAIGEEFSVGRSPEQLPDKKIITAGLPARQAGAAADATSINFILKADVSGSLEALAGAVRKLGAPEGKTVRIIDEGVGEITDGDAKLATSTGAIIIAFNVKVGPAAKTMIKNNHILVFESKIIYHLLESLIEFLKRGGKPPVAGEMEILAIFDQKNILKQVVGGKVISGAIKNLAQVEIRRNEDIIGKGSIVNLQQQKKDVGEAVAGSDCGLLINSQTRINIGDHLIAR